MNENGSKSLKMIQSYQKQKQIYQNESSKGTEMNQNQ